MSTLSWKGANALRPVEAGTKADNALTGSNLALLPGSSPHHGIWRGPDPPAKKTSTLRERYAASQWASGKMVDISQSSILHSTSMMRPYNAGKQDDSLDIFFAYRCTSTNLFGNDIDDAGNDLFSLISQTRSSARNIGTPSLLSDSDFQSRSSPSISSPLTFSSDLASLPISPEGPAFAQDVITIRVPDDMDAEEALVSATMSMEIEPTQKTVAGVQTVQEVLPSESQATEATTDVIVVVQVAAVVSQATVAMEIEPAEETPAIQGSVQETLQGRIDADDLLSTVSNGSVSDSGRTTFSTTTTVLDVTQWVDAVDTFQSIQDHNQLGAASRTAVEARQPSSIDAYQSTTMATSQPIADDATYASEHTEDEGTGGDSDGDLLSTTSKRCKSPKGQAKNLKNNGVHHCPHCESVFTRNFDMNRHITSIHAGLRTDLACPGCPRRPAFSRKDALKRHLRSVAKQPPVPKRRICNMNPAEAEALLDLLNQKRRELLSGE